jgi:hypothetical protein
MTVPKCTHRTTALPMIASPASENVAFMVGVMAEL